MNLRKIRYYAISSTRRKKGPCFIEAYKILRLEKSSTVCYIILIMGYARSPFGDFGSFLGILVGLDEEDIQLFLKQSNSNSVTYELSPGIYSMNDISEGVYKMGDHEGPLQIEYDDISMRAKLILTRFGSVFGTLRFNEKSFFDVLIKFSLSWDYKPTNAIHADSLVVYTTDETLNLGTIDKFFSTSDVTDGSVINGT